MFVSTYHPPIHLVEQKFCSTEPYLHSFATYDPNLSFFTLQSAIRGLLRPVLRLTKVRLTSEELSVILRTVIADGAFRYAITFFVDRRYTESYPAGAFHQITIRGRLGIRRKSSRTKFPPKLLPNQFPVNRTSLCTRVMHITVSVTKWWVVGGRYYEENSA
jgi:hypothetical protein